MKTNRTASVLKLYFASNIYTNGNSLPYLLVVLLQMFYRQNDQVFAAQNGDTRLAKWGE
jgi:hypothetical protein